MPVTAAATGALTDLADLPDIADLLADTWRQRMGSQPPADWLAHATHTLRAHVCSWQLVLVPPLQLLLAPPRRLATGLGPSPELRTSSFDAALEWSRWGQNHLLRWSPKKFAGSHVAQLLAHACYASRWMRT
jgi:hypothetical protein